MTRGAVAPQDDEKDNPPSTALTFTLENSTTNAGRIRAMKDEPPLLLFDGTCGFCAQSVQFVLRHERRRQTLRFASLQSHSGTEVRERHPELIHVDSVIWLEAGQGAS